MPPRNYRKSAGRVLAPWEPLTPDEELELMKPKRQAASGKRQAASGKVKIDSLHLQTEKFGDPPAASDPSDLRRAKLDELHGAYIDNPPTAREERQAEQAYFKALEAKEKQDAEMKLRVARQKAVSEKRAALKRKHEEEYARMNRELDEAAKEAKEAYNEILEVSKRQGAVKAELDKAAERVVRTHGRGPFELGGVMYDVGCYEERVYLVRRHVPSGKRQAASGKARRPGGNR